MPTFEEEHQNTHGALAAHAAKRVLEYEKGDYCVSQTDMDILKACAKNSSFIADKAVAAGSSAEASTTTRAYARTQALLRACQMQAETRLDYWVRALKAAKKDEVFYAQRTHEDLVVHRDFTTTPNQVALVDTRAIDPETGEATASTVPIPDADAAV